MKRLVAYSLATVLALLTGCGSSSETAVDAALPGPDAPPAIDRGPTTIPIDGDPNGIAWDATAKVLYIADQAGNQVLSYTDGGGFGAVVPLPAAPAGQTENGGLAELSDGRLLTPRFGFGTSGGMIIVNTDGTTSMVPNLDMTRRRLGVAVAANGTILDTYFVKTTTTVGAAAILDITAGTETDLIPSLVKPVGLAVIGTTVYVSDQGAGMIFASPLDGSTAPTVFATLTGPDLMCVGPSGSLFSGSTGDSVYQISSGGDVTAFQGGFNATRGVAYDAVNSRLFVAEHVASGTVHALHILPVN